ncbi:MAG: Ig-like domain repeat protein [Acidimicrobiales bacterium]
MSPLRSSGRAGGRRGLAWPSRRPDSEPGARDEGYTMIEVLVTMFVLSIIVVFALGFMTNLLQQATNVHDTMQGVQQDQTASEGLLQYLHAANDVLYGSNATTLVANISAGVVSGAVQSDTLTATLTNSGSPGLDATFATSISPCPAGATSCNTPSIVLDYDAVNSNTVFTYFYNNYAVTPVVLASTNTPTSAQLSEIVAVGVNVTFLAGPHVPIEGFQAVRPSNFITTVYLQNASGAQALTTTTTVAESPAGSVVGTPVTLTATVTAAGSFPDGGTVTFTVSTGGSALSLCTTEEVLNTSNGQAACTFTPSVSGSYSVTAAFSGTNSYQPSSGTTPFNVLQGTTTTLTSTAPVKSGKQWTFTATATVVTNPGGAPVTSGTVQFSLTCTGGSFSGCTGGAGSALNAFGQSVLPASITVNSGAPNYSMTATYAGNSNFASSTSNTLTGTL